MGLALKKVADKTGDPPPGGTPWPLKAVRLQSPLPEVHRFTTDWLQREALAGWVTLNADRIELRLEDRTAVYRVRQWPGVYCLHCGERIAQKPGDQQSFPNQADRLAEVDRQQKHVTACSQGADSPDPQNPAGRKACHYYEAELESSDG